MICQACGSGLLLKQRYQALQVIDRDRYSSTFKVLDLGEDSICYYYLKQYNFNLNNSEKQQIIRVYFNNLFAILSDLNFYNTFSKTRDYFEQDSCFYLVQDWLDGVNLHTIINRSNTFTLDRIWKLLEDILPVLKIIHDRCLVHRNLKPSNIIYNFHHQKYTLVGWNSIGKMLDRNSIYPYMGSSEYAAPEQLRGQAITASDLYSLGMTCLYLLTGVSPFYLIDSASNSSQWRDYWHNHSDNSLDRDRTNKLEYILDKLTAPNLSESPSDKIGDRFICADTVLRMMDESRD
jgi:serine/threonine protein kinase